MGRGKVIDAKPTPKQKQATDNIISGNFKNKKVAMVAAGYKESTALSSQTNLSSKAGVKNYIKLISKAAKKKWDMSLEDKISNVYVDGLGANKVIGSDALEVPDHMARKAFADRLAEFLGWIEPESKFGSKQAGFNQFNFFGTPTKERGTFNEGFKGFLKDYYKD